MSTRLAESPKGEGAATTAASAPAASLAQAKPPTQQRPVSARLPAALHAGSPAWLWLGALVTAAGFALLALGWGKVAGETQVYLQMPYLISAATAAIGVILVGLTVMNIGSRQQDAAARDRQIEQLLAAIEELQEALAEPKRRRQ